MGTAHKAIANYSNADRFFAHLCDRLEKRAEGARLNMVSCHLRVSVVGIALS